MMFLILITAIIAIYFWMNNEGKEIIGKKKKKLNFFNISVDI